MRLNITEKNHNGKNVKKKVLCLSEKDCVSVIMCKGERERMGMGQCERM